MKNQDPAVESMKWSDDQITGIIRHVRNDLIKDFLDERNLIAYFAGQFNLKEVTAVKIEFIKKDLKELLIAPVDIVHYQNIYEHIRETGAAAISDKYEVLFYKEMEKIFKKYIY